MTTNTRRRPTPRAVRQALELMRRLAEPTPREKAERRFMEAKAEYTATIEALIQQEPDAAQRGDAALVAFNVARAALAELDQDQEAPE